MGNTCLIFDFMGVVRSTQKQFSAKNFKDWLENGIYKAKRANSPTMISLVFHSCIKLFR